MRSLLPLLALAACRAPDAYILPLASTHLAPERQLVPVEVGANVYRLELRETDFNETNPGLAAEWTLDDHLRVEAGAYVNSYDDLAPYVGGTWIGHRYRDWLEVGFCAGLAYYGSDGGDWPLTPMAGPMVSFRIGPVWPRVVFVPFAEGAEGVVLVSVRVKR